MSTVQTTEGVIGGDIGLVLVDGLDAILGVPVIVARSPGKDACNGCK